MDLERLHVFYKVLQCGSFTRAAQLLKIPKSSVSKAIAQLEVDNDAKLITRTTRSLSPTDAGRRLFDSCRQPFESIEEALQSVQRADKKLVGRLRITAPEDLGAIVVRGVVAELGKEHPSLEFDLDFSEEVMDLVRDGIDLAVRIGHLQPSALKVRRVGEIQMILVASPAYLRSSPPLREPADLLQHSGICLNRGRGNEGWHLQRGRKSEVVAMRPRFTCNQTRVLVELAVRGCGVAVLPHYLCQSELANGSLRRVLPDYESPAYPVSLLSTIASNRSEKIKLLQEKLNQELKRVLSV